MSRYHELGFSAILQARKKKAYTALLQCRTFRCRKKRGPQRKDFGGRYGFPGFYRVFVSTTGLESFSFSPEKFPKDFLSVVVVYAFFFSVQARKKSRKINFLCPETARWGAGLPREGVVAEKFVLSLESLSSLGFEERNLGCPGNFAGMSRTLGGVLNLGGPSLGVQCKPLFGN